MRDLELEYLEQRAGVCDPLDMDGDDEPTQIERLAQPKCALVTIEDRLQQLLASVYSTYLIHCRVQDQR